ncbi:hypothetical protein NE857_27595 [Nocardiopsis exhalans]|uniref:Peptidase M10 metallopeptidase domain-containing protein n=1 Tax=Nocardiopsis exhalans TaxID=163604 RepID=A0ABY5D705_9ACTN|nr:hypothetical protein [Nocardiopsis exhalans]USY18998.1 hypothetical protein NE857_27595 [Nocardiopsis exhalans]
MTKDLVTPPSSTRRPLAPRRPLARVLAACTTVVLVIALGAVPAHADYYSGGVGTTRFTVRYGAVNDNWIGYFNTGRINWNNTSNTNISITRTTSTSVNRVITAGRYTENWYGIYSPSGTRANRSFSIRINARRLAEDSGSNMSAWCRSTSLHEFGHALSLADNPNTTRLSVMKHSRDRTRITPYAYDTAEVRRIY